MTDLGALGGVESVARGINDAGTIVGMVTTGGDAFFGFVLSRGTVTRIEPLSGGTYTEAFAINAAGDVVGRSQTSDGEQHAILWKDGQLTDLDAGRETRLSRALAINARGDVAGISFFPGEGMRATHWTR